MGFCCSTVFMAADSEATLPALTEACKRSLAGDRNEIRRAREAVYPATVPAAFGLKWFRRFRMRGFALFIAGVGSGILLMQSVVAQSRGANDTGMKLTHVCIAVKIFDQAVAYYTKSMGVREAFAFKGTERRSHDHISANQP